MVQSYLESLKRIYRGLFFGALEYRLQPPLIEASSRFVANHVLRTRFRVDGEDYVIDAPGKPVILPLEFKAAIDFCLSGSEFCASDLPDLTADETRVLLNRLLMEGLIILTP